MMNDLKTKEELLAAFGQKTDIYNNLTDLQDSFEVSSCPNSLTMSLPHSFHLLMPAIQSYSYALQEITMDQADKENIDDAMGGALGQIGSAVSAYA